ncbi:putative hva22 family tb2 dp1 protein [Erysiphe necator]|uniref:Protein YOP1 n=1 Tax=Uncinula necator TaxID=52586 RepID=A0A0B1P493_UNCNE|nr:putative hva22 family tb2 dp1 protein [Erysiphe necator]
MFDTFARLLSSIPTFLFPVFASYKALKTSDPSLLTPWLMYWVVLACALFIESWTTFILCWIPFYSWIRLCFLLYLILPQTQGANVLYISHVHPFLQKNEHLIDEFISSFHDRVKAAGIKYLEQIVEFVKQNLLGFPPMENTPPPAPSKFGYTQSLLARFSLPISKTTISSSSLGSATGSVSDFYSLLTSAVNAATHSDSTSRSLAHYLSSSTSSAERLSFISAQRERLAFLLSALDKEAKALETDLTDGSSTPSKVPGMLPENFPGELDETFERMRGSFCGMVKSRSEADFEKIEAESLPEEPESQHNQPGKNTSGGSWVPWNWRGQVDKAQVNTRVKDAELDEGRAKSSGIEL